MSDLILTQSRLKELLEYNPETGVFIRLIGVPNSRVGSIAGTKNAHGYWQIAIDHNFYFAHRLAWLYMTGKFPDQQIDHINHNRTDNRLVNLRAATPSENQRNKRLGKNNTSGVCGVHWDKRTGKWRARITLPISRVMSLGSFSDKAEAIRARKAAEVKYGFHANHGKSLSEDL